MKRLLLALFLLTGALAAFGQGVSATALLGKPVAQVEAALGKPRHVAKTGERFYKIEGVVRLVARFSARKTLESLTVQFEPGTIPDERAALARIGGMLPAGWAARWSAPGESGNDELFLFQPGAGPARFIATKHLLQRMRERGVTEAQVLDVLKSGQRFWDPKETGEVRWKDGVYVALTEDGVVKTVVRGPIHRRWQPL